MVHADDITDLRENEERLRAVIATLEAGLLTIDLQGRVTDANPAACAIFGLDRERLLNDPAWWQALELRFEDGDPDLDRARPRRRCSAARRPTTSRCCSRGRPAMS